MENKEEHVKDIVENVIDKNKMYRFHSAAVDMRIIALTSLLIEKGLITEGEIQKFYTKVVDSVKSDETLKHDKLAEFEKYLKDFLNVE